MGLTLDLEGHLVFFGSYHNNLINKIIHLIFIPTMTWTILLWLHNSGPLFAWPLENILPLDLSTLVVLLYVSYYALLDTIAAVNHGQFTIIVPVCSCLHWITHSF